MKGQLTLREAREAVLTELRAAGLEDVDERHLAIIPKGDSWYAALRAQGMYIDETVAAAIASVGQRLSAGYSLAEREAA